MNGDCSGGQIWIMERDFEVNRKQRRTHSVKALMFSRNEILVGL
jgi:hypothetical protein